MGILIEIHAERLARALADAPAEARKQMAGVLTRAGALHENIVKRRRFSAYRGESYANRLQRRSGALANAYKMRRASPASLEMVAGIRSGVRGAEYAKIQEFGGIVRPKRSKFLTIPTKAALTPSGALSGRYRIRKSGSGWETDAGETFLFRSRGGNLLIGIKDRHTGKALAKGRGGKRALTAFYVLRRQVTIKPRFGFFSAWDAIERTRIPRWLDQAVKIALAKGGGA